jgi:hypothetical protein
LDKFLVDFSGGVCADIGDNSRMSYDMKGLAEISADLNHATRQMNKDVAKPIRGGCVDHWQNILFFGHCWKHNADGSLKSLMYKRV